MNTIMSEEPSTFNQYFSGKPKTLTDCSIISEEPSTFNQYFSGKPKTLTAHDSVL